MKKQIAMLLTLLMLSASSAACLAETVTAPGGSGNGNVYAKYEETISGVYTSDTDNGETQVTIPDGTVITVTGVQNHSLRLTVMPVPKTDVQAWGWFEGCMKSYGTNIRPLDIGFEDENGNRVPISSDITVTVTMPEAYKNPVVYKLAADGTATALDENTENGKEITFHTDCGSYYVVVEKLSESNPTEPSEPTHSTTPATSSSPSSQTDGNAPQTGDNHSIAQWAAVLLTSAGIFLITLTGSRKKQA